MSKDNFDCTSCQLGKQPALPFNNRESISNSIFELIHSNVWGPSPVTSIGGFRYFVVFIDDYSRYSWIFPMKSRFEILPIYNNFAKMVETQFPNVLKLFVLIMLLNILNMCFKLCYILMALYII